VVVVKVPLPAIILVAPIVGETAQTGWSAVYLSGELQPIRANLSQCVEDWF
jgi:hypothetical protein